MAIRTLSIRAKLVLASAVTVAVAMAVLTAANLYSARQTIGDLISSQTDTLMATSARQLESWAHSGIQNLEALEPVAQQDNIRSYLKQAKASGGYSLVYVGTSQGKLLLSRHVDLPDGFDPRERSWYADAAKAQKPQLTAPYSDAASDGLVLTIAVPIMSNGQIDAVIGGDIGLADVIGTVNSLRPTENSFAYLVSGDGKIIAHPNSELTLKPATQVFAQYDVAHLQQLAQTSGNLKEAAQGGQQYWLRVRPIEGTDWLLVMALDQGDILAGVYQMRTQAIIASIILILVAALALFLLTTALLRRLGSLRNALQDIASGEGDLTRRLDDTGHDELAQVGGAFNQFVDKIADTLREIRKTTDSVHLASDEIAEGNADLSNRTESAAASLEQTSSSMEEISSTVKQTADAGNTAVELVDSARGAARNGGDLMQRVESTMQGINDNSGQISAIVTTMDGIASQTNILALNAAVEAARAGEHGKGFAVVATEVRQLAQRSAQSARDIKELIDTNVSQVSDGTSLVTEAGSAMEKIDSEVRRVSDIINEIKVACNEQSDGISQIETAVQQLDGATQQNAALVQESSAAANSLSQQAQTLARAVAGFKLDADTAEDVTPEALPMAQPENP